MLVITFGTFATFKSACTILGIVKFYVDQGGGQFLCSGSLTGSVYVFRFNGTSPGGNKSDSWFTGATECDGMNI